MFFETGLTCFLSKGNLAPLWPFFGTLGQIVILGLILFFYERFYKKGDLFKSSKTKPMELTDTRSDSSQTDL